MTSRTDTATAHRDRLAAELDRRTAELKALEERIEALEDELAQAERELAAAIAADASGSIPVGTRVHHRTFADLHGTIAPTNGEGIAVHQDGAGAITYGFGPDEWIAD